MIHPSNKKLVRCAGNSDANSNTGSNFQSGVTHTLSECLMIRSTSRQVVDGHRVLADLFNEGYWHRASQ